MAERIRLVPRPSPIPRDEGDLLELQKLRSALQKIWRVSAASMLQMAGYGRNTMQSINEIAGEALEP